MPCEGIENPIHARQRGKRERSQAFGAVEPARRTFGREQRNFAPPSRASEGYSSGLVGPLSAKLASIQSACPGTHAISGVRHTRIAGTRRMSLHAQGKAVDVRGPYGCIYGQLKGWTGGYSTDAGRAKHIHISYDDAGGREMGLRFAHGGSRSRSWRNSYARMR